MRRKIKEITYENEQIIVYSQYMENAVLNPYSYEYEIINKDQSYLHRDCGFGTEENAIQHAVNFIQKIKNKGTNK